MKMKFIIYIFVCSINCTVKEVLKKNSGMMHHKLVKDYSLRMTKLMLKQRQNYPCDRYLKDNEIDYTRQINVHYKNPVYGIIQLDHGKKFTILNHAFYSIKSQTEVAENLRFKPALNARYKNREPLNLQMQCILYAKIGARHYIANRQTILFQVSFYSNCKDQRAVRFFELKGGSPTLQKILIQNKSFQLKVNYQGELKTGEIFNSYTKFYPDYSIKQVYNPKKMKGDFRWRWIRERFRKNKIRQLSNNSKQNKLADYEFAKQNRLLRNLTSKQKKKADLSEKDFQNQNDKKLQRKIKRKLSKQRRNLISQKRTLHNKKGDQEQIKDVGKGYNMIVPNFPKQFFEIGTLDGIWNSPSLIQCQPGFRKLNLKNKKLNKSFNKSRILRKLNSFGKFKLPGGLSQLSGGLSQLSGGLSQLSGGLSKLSGGLSGTMKCNI